MVNEIHETVIRDLIDIVTSIRDSDEVQMVLNKNKSFKSVSNASANLTLVFPVACTRSLSIQNASMISKAIERKAVTMLQMLFSAVCITDSKDGFDYIKKFHTNLKLDGDMTVDEFMDTMDRYVVESENSNIVTINRDEYNLIKEDLKNLNFTFQDLISESSINDYKILPKYGEDIIIKEAPLFNANAHRDAISGAKSISDTLRNANDMIRNQLVDTDIKKANELVPTLMLINFVSTNNETPIANNMLIGVKAKLYPVDSVDIMNRIKLKNEDNNGLLKFIRATTRETGFLKDLIFALDKAKLDALSQSRRGSSSKLWKVLERRSLKSKLRRTWSQSNDAAAITTLVVSQEEVEYLKKNDNIDVENPRVIRPIMEAYNLMGLCIVDENMETAKFIFDTGEDIYEVLSFNHLEREASDNGSKKIINLMTKLAR